MSLQFEWKARKTVRRWGKPTDPALLRRMPVMKQVLSLLCLGFLGLSSCASYSGVPLTSVMEIYCSDEKTFPAFHECTNRNWYYQVVSEGFGNEPPVQLFKSRMNLLEIAVASRRMSNAEAIADAKYLAYQLRAQEYAAVQNQNVLIMQGLSTAAGQTYGGQSRPSSAPAGYSVCSYRAGTVTWTETYRGICPVSSSKGGFVGSLQQ